MSPAAQRYEVSQIFAEAQAKGWPFQVACFAALNWFAEREITPPASIISWLAEVPQEQWRPAMVH